MGQRFPDQAADENHVGSSAKTHCPTPAAVILTQISGWGPGSCVSKYQGGRGVSCLAVRKEAAPERDVAMSAFHGRSFHYYKE